MKKLTLISVCVILSGSLISLLAFSEEDANGPKAEMDKTVMMKRHCAKTECGPNSQDPMGDASRLSCHQMQRSSQMCHMMGMMPMRHQMMGGRGCKMRSKCCYPMEMNLGRLGCAETFIVHAEMLELSDDQVDQLKSIKNDQHKWDIQKKADIEVARVELKELLDGQPVSFDKIKSKISQIADMEKDVRLARLAAIQRARKVLTAEQLQKAQNMRKTRTRRMRKGPRQMTKEIIIEETEE